MRTGFQPNKTAFSDLENIFRGLFFGAFHRIKSICRFVGFPFTLLLIITLKIALSVFGKSQPIKKPSKIVYSARKRTHWKLWLTLRLFPLILWWDKVKPVIFSRRISTQSRSSSKRLQISALTQGFSSTQRNLIQKSDTFSTSVKNFIASKQLKIKTGIVSKVGLIFHNFARAIAKFNHTLQIHRRVRLSYILIILVVGSFSYGGWWFYDRVIKDLPDPTQLSYQTPNLTTKIYDRNGILLYKIYQQENRSLVSLEDIPAELIQATIAIEDQTFFQHPGFSVRGISRAIKVNLSSDSLHGGSTLTQQLIKNTLLTSERTFDRKLKEVVLSFLTEFYYTKDEILTMYFNQVPYGGTAYGVQEASQMYFGKDVQELNLAESSFLAGLPNAPSRYSPYGPNPELAYIRQKQVLRRMVEDGYITRTQASEASRLELALKPHREPIVAPHFVMFVKDYLADTYGSRIVETGGLEVVTTIDLGLQAMAEEMVKAEVEKLAPLQVSNGAALITNPKTGEILAMVGSRDYFDTFHDGQVNVTIRERQPGSSIKPLSYAFALENGFTPATIIADTPTCYPLPNQPAYCPKNYDGNFHGNVTVRAALANSYNIPAVKTLNQFGVKEFVKKATAMGITTWSNPDRYGLALTLGGGEVKMVDMAVAYGTFSNQGNRVRLNPLLSIKDHTGKDLDHTKCPPEQSEHCRPERVLDPAVAFQISDILSDNQARSQAFGTNSVLHIPGQQVAVKTGTTNSLRDNWTIGYTGDRLVATWIGNNDNRPMSQVASGITGASPIWRNIMEKMLDPENPHTFTPPANLAKVSICSLTGSLPCNGCPSREEYFILGTEPKNHCSFEQIARTQDSPSPLENPQP